MPSKSIGKVSDTLDTYWMPQCPLVWENIFSISPICMNDVIFSKGRHVTDGGAGNLSYYIPLCNHISPQFRPTWLALQSNLISICFHPNFPFIMIQTYCNQINGRQVQRGRVYLFYHTFEVFFWRVKSLSNKNNFLRNSPTEMYQRTGCIPLSLWSKVKSLQDCSWCFTTMCFLAVISGSLSLTVDSRRYMLVPGGRLWFLAVVFGLWQQLKDTKVSKELFQRKKIFCFSLQFGIGRDRRTDAAVISRWQPPRLVGLPETILKGGRDEKY